MGDKYEGDIVVSTTLELRTVLRDKERKWPTTEIPYRIETLYFYDEETERIKAAIEEFNNFTCVSFRPATENDTDYIVITGKTDGCYTTIGRAGGEQVLNLEPPACIYKKGCIFHEFMHALGFSHEHNSPIRDKYVRIHTKNIAKGKESFLKKLNPEDVTDYGYDYDYNSIMHGGRKAYSGNNRSTIEPVDEFASIGYKRKLSRIDIKKVNRHFGCI
ncbi:zinc metalloproteinase nas-14-like isoform X1 [Schistocerca nitens]|uniref:zinc metalloproteinase nas-14-like isoform X1 n=1 Tax=Schistocerca nitens TaxID=7011 RepID=UPI002119ABA3|nr:zinc metalloproteinase nas-14-like isoform X1 [Schistocerca nitens]